MIDCNEEIPKLLNENNIKEHAQITSLLYSIDKNFKYIGYELVNFPENYWRGSILLDVSYDSTRNTIFKMPSIHNPNFNTLYYINVNGNDLRSILFKFHKLKAFL